MKISASFAGVLFACLHSFAAEPSRPNFLLIFTDDKYSDSSDVAAEAPKHAEINESNEH